MPRVRVTIRDGRPNRPTIHSRPYYDLPPCDADPLGTAAKMAQESVRHEWDQDRGFEPFEFEPRFWEGGPA